MRTVLKVNIKDTRAMPMRQRGIDIVQVLKGEWEVGELRWKEGL
jgi:hypothetical protein